jgi:hypothetical protein
VGIPQQAADVLAAQRNHRVDRRARLQSQGDKMMPAYMVEIAHLETDQIFSYYHGDTMLHFNATLLARLHKQMPGEFRRITMDLAEDTYELCMTHRGIDEAKVSALPPKSLRDPGYGVFFDDGLFTIVDGHHRLVRRWRGGVRVMDFWVTTPAVWQHCLARYTAEGEALIAEGMPPKADDPALIASPVIVHGKKDK